MRSPLRTDRRPLALAQLRFNRRALCTLQYNLKLVEERDAELDRYDGQFALLKQQLRDKDALVSEARVAIADLEQQLKQSQHRYGEQEAYFTVRLRQPVLSPTAPCRHI
jgi:hypothetical protein